MPVLISGGYHGEFKNKIKLVNFNAGHYQNNRPLASSLGGGAHYIGNAPAVGHYPSLYPPRYVKFGPDSSPRLFTYLGLSRFCTSRQTYAIQNNLYQTSTTFLLY